MPAPLHTLQTAGEAVQWLRTRVTGTLQTDSRLIRPGDGFIAWPGAATDGRAHVADAMVRGATACLVEQSGVEAFGFTGDHMAALHGLKGATGPIAAQWFDHPTSQLAVLAVTGNISWDETVKLTEKWFAPIPRRDVPVRQLPQEPEQTQERRLTVERNVPLDALFMGYHMCSREGADYYAFDILSDILSNGRSSRLNRRLVQEQNIFSGIDAYISGTRDAGLLQISGKPAAGVSLEQAEAAVRKELEELQRSPVDGQELEKVKNKFESTQIFGNINYLNVATNLAWFELTGKAEDIDLEVERYRSVTTEQLHTVAQRTFCESNAVVLYYKSDK